MAAFRSASANGRDTSPTPAPPALPAPRAPGRTRSTLSRPLPFDPLTGHFPHSALPTRPPPLRQAPRPTCVWVEWRGRSGLHSRKRLSVHSCDPPIIHRDIKPSNVLIGGEPWRIALADFGIAKPDESSDVGLTKTNEVVGSKNYRAPETLVGSSATPRTEVYSLGRTLEWMLTGREPEDAVPRPIPPSELLSEPARGAIDAFLRKACSLEPTTRFEDVTSLRRNIPSLLLALNNEPKAVSIGAVSTDSPPEIRSETAQTAYVATKSILRNRDAMAWRESSKYGRKRLHDALLAWRREREHHRPENSAALASWMDEVLVQIGPRLAEAVALTEFPGHGLGDPLVLISDLLAIPGWNGSGLTVLVQLPVSIVYVCTNVLGAVAVSAGDPAAVLPLCNKLVRDSEGDRNEKPLWQCPQFVGWPVALGQNATDAWTYVYTLCERHPWLREVFGDTYDYQASLLGYWWLLSAVELADHIKSGTVDGVVQSESVWFAIPGSFLLEDTSILEASFRRVFSSPRAVTSVAAVLGISADQLYQHWGPWTKSLGRFASKFTANGWPRGNIRVPALPK